MTIEVNGCQVYFEERGEGEPLLLLHGGTGIGSDWQYVFTGGDPEGFRVIVPDLRGHGRSTNTAGRFTFRQCAQDMLALLDHLGIRRVSAIGMSAGAKTLLHIATMRPELIGAMVLVSAAPRFPPEARAAMARLTTDVFTEAQWVSLRTRHVHGDDQIRRLWDQMRALKDDHDDMAFTAATLGAIAARTLIVHGDRDPLYPVELALEMYRAIPRSALWVVANGQHGPIFGPLAAPFVDGALHFLREPPAPGG